MFAAVHPSVPLFYDAMIMSGCAAPVGIGTLDGPRHFAAFFNTSVFGARRHETQQQKSKNVGEN